MAKLLCVFALAGMAAGSPVAYRVSSADQEVVVNRIMTGLQPAIDAAIAKALGGLYSSSSSGSGSWNSNAGYGTSVNQGFSTSNQGFSASQQGVTKGTSHFQSAGANGVVYHDGSSSAIGQQAGNSAQYTVTNQQSVSSASNQQTIVQGVMAALVPQIEAAVQAAMRRQQSAAVSSTSFNTGVSTSTISQVNAQEEQALVSRIIQVLTPTITTSVRNALAARVQTVQVQAPVTTVTQSSSFNQNAGIDTSALIAQIIRVLKPSIALSVEEALASQQQQSFNSFNTQTVQTANNQASQGFSSGAVSSGNLASIFGDGSAHNVKVQTPEYTIEYNN